MTVCLGMAVSVITATDWSSIQGMMNIVKRHPKGNIIRKLIETSVHAITVLFARKVIIIKPEEGAALRYQPIRAASVAHVIVITVNSTITKMSRVMNTPPKTWKIATHSVRCVLMQDWLSVVT